MSRDQEIDIAQLRQALAVYREHVSEYCGARRLLPSGYTDLCVLPVEHDGPCIFDAALGAAVTPTPQDEETLPGIYDVMRLQAASERAIADIYGPVTSTPTPQETGGETRCSRCGGPNVSWCAPSPLWNEVMRGGSIDGPWQYSEIICPTCFCVLTEAAGVALDWRVDAQTVNVPLQTVTPTGRVWDAENWLWVTSTPEAATEDGPTFSICATHRPQVPGCPRCYPSLVDFLLVIHPSTSGDDGNKVCATCVDSGTPTPYPCATLQAAAHFTSPVPAPSGLQRATEQQQ